MKKLICVLFIICVLFSIPMTVFAGNNTIVGISDIEEDLGKYKDAIYEDYCSIISNENENYVPSESDIMFDKAIRMYWDMPFLEENELTRAQMEEFTRLSAYVYFIPVKYGNKYADLIVTKSFHATFENNYNLDMPEEFYKFYFEGDEQWHIQSIDFDYYHCDYVEPINELLDDYGIDNATVYAVNSIGVGSKNLLVIFRENSDTAEFVILDDLINHRKLIPNTEFGEKTYTYSEMKELDVIARNALGSGENLTGYNFGTETSNNLQYALIAGGVVLALTAVAGIVLVVRKKKAKAAD